MSNSIMRRTMFQVIKHHSKLSSVTLARKKVTKSENNLVNSVFNDIPELNLTVNEFMWQNLDRWPDKTATVCAVTGRGYTYGQLHKMSHIFAASLRSKLKMQVDDKVAIILPNIPEYPCVVLGVLQAGCIASPMNPIYTAEELTRLLDLTECKLIISSKISYANIKSALETLKMKVPVILLDNEDLPEGTIKFAELASDLSVELECLKSVRRSPKDIAILPFSSGTTGFAKGVVLTHGSVVALNQMIADPEIVAIKETTATYQAVIPAVIPFFHIFGFNALMMNQMYLGCKIVTLPYFKPELFLETLVKHRAAALFIVPPMVVFLGKHPAVKPEHLESVATIISGAAPVSKEDAQAVLVKNPQLNFRQGYGLTETNGGISVGRKTDTNHASIGHVFAKCQVKIADLDTQEALPAGKEGEIWFRGPNLMREYYKNDEATKEALTEDGWYKTGDIGKYDENSYLYVTDRLKELIKVKGFQVPPAELESILRTHPMVLDCAVLGLPDPITGEVPKAFVVKQTNQELSEEEILEHVNSRVASFKKVKEVQFVNEIPKNPAGKILRNVIKQKYC